MSRLIRGLYVDETQRANNRIVLSNRIGAGVALRKAAMHELTHYIEGGAGYDPYKEAVLKAAYRNDTDGNLRAADESRIQETYANAGIELDETTIEKELVAEATGKIISDPDGRIVILIMIQTESEVNGVRIDANHMASTYGKNNAMKLFENALKKEKADNVGVYYEDKNRASVLVSGPGLQLPGDSNQDGLIHSIFDAGSPVNRKYLEHTETRQFKRWFGKNLH